MKKLSFKTESFFYYLNNSSSLTLTGLSIKINKNLKEEYMRHKQEGIYSIDYFAYISNLRKLNPTFKFIFAFIVLVFNIAVNCFWVSVFIFFSMSFITVCLGKLNLIDYLLLLTIPFLFMFAGSFAIALNISKTAGEFYSINLHWFYLYFSNESIFNALKIMMKSMGAVSILYMLILSTPACEIINVLQKLHMPKLIIELMNMIYRFIFILLDVYCKMKYSAQSRLGYCDFKTSCCSFGNLAGNLLLISFKRANAYYDSLISRGYEGSLLFLEEEKHLKRIHILIACLYIILLIIIWIIVK